MGFFCMGYLPYDMQNGTQSTSKSNGKDNTLEYNFFNDLWIFEPCKKSEDSFKAYRKKLLQH